MGIFDVFAKKSEVPSLRREKDDDEIKMIQRQQLKERMKIDLQKAKLELENERMELEQRRQSMEQDAQLARMERVANIKAMVGDNDGIDSILTNLLSTVLTKNQAKPSDIATSAVTVPAVPTQQSLRDEMLQTWNEISPMEKHTLRALDDDAVKRLIMQQYPEASADDCAYALSLIRTRDAQTSQPQ